MPINPTDLNGLDTEQVDLLVQFNRQQRLRDLLQRVESGHLNGDLLFQYSPIPSSRKVETCINEESKRKYSPSKIKGARSKS